MGILKSLGAYLGGLITVLAIISFIFVFSVNVSQASLSNAFNHITINSTGLGSLNSTSGAQTVCSLLASGSVNATNSTCSIFSILSGFVSSVPGGSIYSSFFTPSSFYSYSILLLVLAVIGSLMVFFSAFSWKGISAVGKNVLSSAAVSFFVTFIPVMFFLPIILSFHYGGLALNIPSNIFESFAVEILSLDIIFGVIGIVLVIIAVAMERHFGKPKPPTPKSKTQLIVQQG